MSKSSQSPDAPVDMAVDLRLRPEPPRVMRLSRKALAIMGAVAGTSIGGALVYALKPPSHSTAKELYSTQSRATADGLASAPRDYGEVPRLGPPLPGDLGRPILSAQQRGTDVPVPPISATPAQGPLGSAANAARQQAAQERDAARTSQLFLSGRTGAAIATPTFDTLASTPPGLGGAAVMSDPGADAALAQATTPNGQNSKRAFLSANSDHRTTSNARIMAPASANIIQAGSVISAALITGIRSDLPGQITAQVTQNVYDSPTGRILLIPQGARLIGEYDAQVSFGQNRVLLAWTRLILPGGASITLERQPGTDAAGFAGLQDGTNYHWGNTAKAALISTLLGIGTELGANGGDALTQAIRRGTQDTLNQTGQQIVRQQLNVQPTLTVRPGFPVRVVVTRDLILEPVQQEIRQ